MECPTSFRYVLFVIFIQLSALNCAQLPRTYLNDVSTNNGEIAPRISWLFSNSADTVRVKRASAVNYYNLPVKCQQTLGRLCGDINGNNDELMLLECIQAFKVKSSICYHLRKYLTVSDN